jgi:hydrogenase expression/formation protein HypE
MAIMASRHGLDFGHNLKSDCASLSGMIAAVLDGHAKDVRFMRDATRGGIATVCCEWAENRQFGIDLLEDNVPVRESVRGICEILGVDPLYVANEGRILMIVDAMVSQSILSVLHSFSEGEGACVIGSVVSTNPGRVVLQTSFGGSRYVSMLSGAQLPRIC